VALAAPGASREVRGQRHAEAERRDAGSSRVVRFTVISDLDSNTGSPEWRRPGFVFSARGWRRAERMGTLLLETLSGTFIRSRRRRPCLISISPPQVEREDLLSSFARSVVHRRSVRVVWAAGGGRCRLQAAFLRSLGLPVDSLSADPPFTSLALLASVTPPSLGRCATSALRFPRDREPPRSQPSPRKPRVCGSPMKRSGSTWRR
jgi:hypothetical protein